MAADTTDVDAVPAGERRAQFWLARALVSDLLGRSTRRVDRDLRRLATAMRLTRPDDALVRHE